MNMTTAAIDFFAWIGLAYDLKTVPKNIVKSRVQRTGDGTHPYALEDSHHLEKDLKLENEYCEIFPETE